MPDLDLEQRLETLGELLRSIFDGDELRHFLRTLDDGPRLVDELPGPSASFAEVVHEATLALSRFRLLDVALFDGLVQARPRARADIVRVAALWQVTLTRVSDPPALARWSSSRSPVVWVALGLAACAAVLGGLGMYFAISSSNSKHVDSSSVAVTAGTTAGPTAQPDGRLVAPAPPNLETSSPTCVPIPFVALPDGAFWMGSPDGHGADDERPRRQVALSGFWIARTELTQGQWAQVVALTRAAGDSEAVLLPVDPSKVKGDNNPVESISWCDAARFANALSRLEGYRAAYTVSADCERGGAVTWDLGADGYRLPTEAEWEYAARAGSDSAWSFGDDAMQICAFGNVADQTLGAHAPGNNIVACDDAHENTAPVCSFAPNAWGLCDVHGNVWEPTWDWYAEKPAVDAQPNPTGPSNGSRRVVRGGSWLSDANITRVANRFSGAPSIRDETHGLRLARSR